MPLGNPHLDYNTNPQSPGYKGPFNKPQKPVGRDAGVPKKHKPVGLSPQAWAQKQAASMIQAQIDAINEQQNIYLQQQSKSQQQAMDRAAAMYAALMGQGFDAKIGGAFNAAANDTRGMAAGLGGVMQTEAGNAAANDNRMLSGTGQEARNEGAGMNEVFSNAYGIIPGSALDRIGRAYAGDAANQPRFNLQEGLLNAVRDNAPDVSEYAMQIAKLKGTQPEIAMKLLGQRQDLIDQRLKRQWAIQDRKYEKQQDAYKRRQDAIDNAHDWYLDQAKLAMSQGNFERAQAYFNLAVQRENRMGQNQAFNQQYKLDHPTGAKAKSEVWGNLQEDISNDIPDLTMEIPDPTDKYSPNPRKVKVPLGYNKAFKILVSRYGGKVKDRKRLTAMIDKILAANGIKKPKTKAPFKLYGAGEGDYN